jgi:hypothetical protein
MGATTGFAGTARAQQQLRDALEFPGALVLQQPEVLVSEAYLRFDEHGDLVDDEVREQIAELLAALTRAPAQAGGPGSLPLEADPPIEEPVGEVDRLHDVHRQHRGDRQQRDLEDVLA